MQRSQKLIDNLKYIILIILISIIFTFLIHILLGLLWSNDSAENVNITTIESLSTILFVPLSVSFLHYYIAKKNHISLPVHFISLVVIIFCVWLSAYLHFENWAKYIGNKNAPDNGTLEVIGFTRGVGYIIGIVGFTISFFQLKKIKKSLNKVF